MNVLFTCQKGRTVLFKGWESRGLHYGERRSRGPWILQQPPCQAAVNKASAELKNGNEFLIGDTLYLSSWQRSDCTAAFSFFVLVRALLFTFGPLHDTHIPTSPPPPPYLLGSLTCEGGRQKKKTKQHNNRASSWMITLNYSLGYLKSWINQPPFLSASTTKASLCCSLQSC